MGKVVTEVAVGDKDHEVNESLIKYPADRKLKKTRNIQRAFYHTNYKYPFENCLVTFSKTN